MGRLKSLKLARPPPRLDTFTDIHAPSVKRERVNGKDKYSLTPAKPGVITIYSDDENGKDRTPRSGIIKEERSQIPPCASGRRHQSSQPHIKQEAPLGAHGRQPSYGQASPGVVAPSTRQPQVHEPSRPRGAHSSSNRPSSSPSSSESSGSDSSESSSEDQSDSSTDSSSSDESSSEDETSASVYRPTTPASSIGSSPAQTRRKKGTDVRATSTNLEITSPSRRSPQNRASLGSGHAPLDLFIDLPSRPLPKRPKQSGRSRSQTSSAAVPTRAQVSSYSPPSVYGARVTESSNQAGQDAHHHHHRPNHSSPVVQGFMPINRVSPPPPQAPTEPRAMHTGGARPAGPPSRNPQGASVSVGESVSGSSALPFRGLAPVKDNSQQMGKQRRGPARPGRIMQTIEQPPIELFSSRSQSQKGPSSSHLRAATPGPSSRRTAPPQPSPGIFVTPRAVSVRPVPTPRHEDAPQRVSRSQGKRSFDEAEDTDSASKTAELERMLERIKNHEKEMEQQRAQLEDTKRLLAEQKTRIDDLEQQRRAEELVRDPDVQTRIEERDVTPPQDTATEHVAPLPEAAPRVAATPPVAVPRHLASPPDAVSHDVAPRRVSSRQAQRREEKRRRNASQAGRREERRRQFASQGAQNRLKRQEKRRLEQEKQEGLALERQRLEEERQEDLELEQQLEQEQRREVERHEQRHPRVARESQNSVQHEPPQVTPESEDEAQRRIQHEVFSRPLSGHNPTITFDDEDRPYVSKATAFLMRLPQAFVLAKLRKLARGKAFFDLAHPGSVHMGCWVVSRRASCDSRMKLMESGEKHGFSFERLAVRLWHDEQSIYKLVQHDRHQPLAVRVCHTDTCMRPDHIVVEPSSAAAERRRCKREGWCPGHKFFHKDGTRQARKHCIFPPQGAFIRR